MRKPLLKKLTLCSIYSALAIISFVIENLFPPLFLPGARMGVSNVFTFTGYDGLDPDLSYGIDREVYPRPRTYTFGLNLKF